ncbi:MAG: hypothetical protein ACR2LV_01330 [Solirubrobacteraceae bacterium]
MLRRRASVIETEPCEPAEGFEHLDRRWLAVLQWLAANRVDHVLLGVAAQAVRGQVGAAGPVAIVPAPYGRNLERLAHALGAGRARLRVDGNTAELARPGATFLAPVKLSAEKLAGERRWALRCGDHDLDVEGRIPGVPRYQELLYEAGRFELAAGVSVEVASEDDLARYAHARGPGEPEIRITRNPRIEPGR